MTRLSGLRPQLLGYMLTLDHSKRRESLDATVTDPNLTPGFADGHGTCFARISGLVSDSGRLSHPCAHLVHIAVDPGAVEFANCFVWQPIHRPALVHVPPPIRLDSRRSWPTWAKPTLANFRVLMC